MLPTSTVNWVHHWETAGAHLAESLTIYLDACLKLSTGKLENTADANDLVSRIDHTLESLYAALEQQVAQSRSTLARTRNRLVAKFYSVPQEILAEIFTLVVYDQSGRDIQFIEDDIRAFYHRLHSLLAVCTIWRDIGISNGALWTLIPMISRKSGWISQAAAERSYERAGGRGLHLAASIEKRITLPFCDAMDKNFGRFRSINAVFQDKILLSQAIRPLMKPELPPNILDELSLYRFLEHLDRVGLDIPDEHEFLTSLQPLRPYSMSINTVVQSLRVLRMKNVHVHWQFMILPKLVELRIESVMIDAKANFRNFLSALRTAPQLQKLELILLNTQPNTDEALDQAPVPIPLPNLQNLYIGDMYADDAEMILRSITPVSYRLSLYLTIKMATVMHLEEETRVGLDWLFSTLYISKVDTLLIEGDEVWENWIESGDLRVVVFSMPLVKTLKFDYWEFGPPEGQVLTCSPGTIPFVQLRSLQFTNLRLKAEGMESFKNFISCHPIQHLTLGGTVETLNPSNAIDSVQIKESDSLVDWLRSKVPDFRFVEDGYIPPQFRTHHWELW